ncbi:hypothetical protein NDU88_004191 [Pleurodeles waltl]|uniref:Uncharacterized protein n=1 Tax=Pleurodeles waltl TaxID=8319 RepID=A0AAV7W8C1_PLEWA|nr:hypothetical protein NDU88_004191 [Pleurodeles waltl]
MNKCGWFLANKLGAQRQAARVEAVVRGDGSEVKCDNLIVSRFWDFYEDLYFAQSLSTDNIKSYLIGVHTPLLIAAQADELDCPVQIEEVISARAHHQDRMAFQRYSIRPFATP